MGLIIHNGIVTENVNGWVFPGAEELPKFGGAKYITRTYLYGENLTSYGAIVKVGGKLLLCPSPHVLRPWF